MSMRRGRGDRDNSSSDRNQSANAKNKIKEAERYMQCICSFIVNKILILLFIIVDIAAPHSHHNHSLKRVSLYVSL